MSSYFDRDGRAIDFRQFAQIVEGVKDAKRVAETTLPNGRWVSTVWLGIDHAFGQGPPLIFETMVFPSKDGPLTDLDCDRYSTEDEALRGHQRMVEKWSKPDAERGDE
jgi:hypothetical protein